MTKTSTIASVVGSSQVMYTWSSLIGSRDGGTAGQQCDYRGGGGETESLRCEHFLLPLLSGKCRTSVNLPRAPGYWGSRNIPTDFSRISTLPTLPVTVIGNSSVMCT